MLRKGDGTDNIGVKTGLIFAGISIPSCVYPALTLSAESFRPDQLRRRLDVDCRLVHHAGDCSSHFGRAWCVLVVAAHTLISLTVARLFRHFSTDEMFENKVNPLKFKGYLTQVHLNANESHGTASQRPGAAMATKGAAP